MILTSSFLSCYGLYASAARNLIARPGLELTQRIIDSHEKLEGAKWSLRLAGSIAIGASAFTVYAGTHAVSAVMAPPLGLGCALLERNRETPQWVKDKLSRVSEDARIMAWKNVALKVRIFMPFIEMIEKGR